MTPADGLNDVQRTILNAIDEHYTDSRDAAPVATVFKTALLTYPNAAIQDVGEEFGALVRAGLIWRPHTEYVARCEESEKREQVEAFAGPGDELTREMVGVGR